VSVFRKRLAYRQARNTVLIGMVLGLLVGAVQFAALVRDRHAEVEAELGRLLSAVRGSASQAVFELDRRLAQESVDGLLAYRYVRGARIVDEHGSVLAVRSRALANVALRNLADRVFGTLPPRWRSLVSPVGGAALGTLEVSLDNTFLMEEALSRVRVILLGDMVWALLLAGLVALLFHYSLTRPLLGMVRRLARIRPEHSSAAALAIPRGHEHDELGMLVCSVRELIDRYADNLAARNEAETARVESDARFQSLFDHAPAGVCLKDTQGHYLLANRRFERFYGLRSEDLFGKDARDVVSADRACTIRDHERVVIESGRAIEREECYEFEGRTTTVMVVKFPILDAADRVIGVGDVELDISERKRAEQALRESEERFRDVADAAADGIWELDQGLRFSYVSDRLCALIGLPRAALIGRTPRAVFGAAVRLAGVRSGVKLSRRRAFRDLRVRYQRGDGEIRWWSLNGKPVFNVGGVFRGYRGTGSDITDAQALSQQLSFQASHDALTGLINRRTFEQRLGRMMESVRIDGAEHALCYIDLDQFKVINDTCGHVAGDELLRQLGRVLAAEVRERDTLARLGGDEFGVLLERCSIDQAYRVASALHKAIERFQFVWEDKRFRVGASIGLAPVDALGADGGEVLAMADSACYAAKERGRNQIRVFRTDDADLASRQGEMQWIPRIHEALEAGRLELYFQSIAPLAKGVDARGPHYELLLRMRGADGRLIPPGAFMPAAERYGLVTTLDRWVVDTALTWLAASPAHLSELELCAINLSGSSLSDDEFLGFVLGRIEASEVPAEKLCFEITETAAIGDLSSATRFLHSLRAFGCRFALDDFGSGLSSFAYLKTLPVDYLKIDGVFVREIANNAVDYAMVKSINEVGHVMGKRTVAEFVENDAIEGALREIGIDYAQGYGIARPRPLSELNEGPEAHRQAAAGR